MNRRRLHMDGGGRILPGLREAGAPQSGEPIVLLVHGFNNDAMEAGESYFTLRLNLDALLRQSGIDVERRKALQERIWELYWPGYELFPGTVPRTEKRSAWLSTPGMALYAWQVRKARNWVPAGLAEYLQEVAPSEVFFIGHSLGCRVILETIDRLLAGRGVPVSGFLLMAGAVPIDLLTRGGRLRAGAASAKRGYVLHSWRDLVLAGAFPLGQILAGEQPIYDLPVATGLGGWPPKLFRVRSNTRLGHSDYWNEGILKDESTCRDLLGAIFHLAWSKGIGGLELLKIPVNDKLSILPGRQLAAWRIPGESWLRDRYGPGAR